MAPPGHGAGVGFVIPKLLSWPNSADVTDVMAEPRKRGYAKPAIS
ncbi:type IV secretory system conjugative DNA transfer family protein [Pseudomonas fragi]